MSALRVRLSVLATTGMLGAALVAPGPSVSAAVVTPAVSGPAAARTAADGEGPGGGLPRIRGKADGTYRRAGAGAGTSGVATSANDPGPVTSGGASDGAAADRTPDGAAGEKTPDGAAGACAAGGTVVDGVNAGGNWAPVTPGKWQFPGDQVILAQAGAARPGPRRPFEYAVLRTGPEFASVEIEAQVRLDTPTSVDNRDVVIVFGYRSDTRFYYVHLSQDNTIYPHNGLFVVDDADRLRLDHQWNGQVGAPPAVTDTAWHRVRITHCVPTGEIAVFMDGSTTPLMTATDRRLGSGRVGFGSFDNIGRMRDMKVTGTPICAGQAATVTGTPGADVLTGTEGNDVIAALGGDDLVRPLGGDDVVCAGNGRDVVLAGDGADRVLGEAGRDLLSGQKGDDSLYGGTEPDLLDGGPGDDRLYGARPEDVLVGGPGRDTSHPDPDQTPAPRIGDES
jgi:hypothetical protein